MEGIPSIRIIKDPIIEREIEIHEANHLLFMRRALNPKYGTEEDRKAAYQDAKNSQLKAYNLSRQLSQS